MDNITIRGAHLTTLRIDGDYDNQLPNPYTADTGAGRQHLTIGVIAWSLGSDQSGSVRQGRQEFQYCVRRRDFVAVIFADSVL